MRKIALLFPGGGAQRVGMMIDICQRFSLAQSVFDEADKILGRSISNLTFNGTEEKLSLIQNMQPCMLTAEIALWRVLTFLGVKPSMVAGFSLGEYSALVASGVLPFEETLLLSQQRANYMREAAAEEEGGMAVIFGKSEEEINTLCNVIGDISPSNFTCPGQITVSGKIRGIKKLMEMKAREEIAAHQVQVDVPSHCALMYQASKRLGIAIRDLTFEHTKTPLVMNINAKVVSEPDVIKNNLIEQLCKPVKFQQTIEFMIDSGINTFIEVGPGDVLSRFVTKTARYRDVDVESLNIEDIETLEQTLAIINE